MGGASCAALQLLIPSVNSVGCIRGRAWRQGRRARAASERNRYEPGGADGTRPQPLTSVVFPLPLGPWNRWTRSAGARSSRSCLQARLARAPPSPAQPSMAGGGGRRGRVQAQVRQRRWRSHQAVLTVMAVSSAGSSTPDTPLSSWTSSGLPLQPARVSTVKDRSLNSTLGGAQGGDLMVPSRSIVRRAAAEGRALVKVGGSG